MDMKRLRHRSQKRTEEVAAELGVAISTIRNWEQNKNAPRMTPKGFQKLMEVYECTLDELIQMETKLEEKGQRTFLAGVYVC